MGLPQAVSSVSPLSLYLLVVHGTISAAFINKMAACTRFSSWVMREYGVVESWTKLYVVDMPDGISCVFGFRLSGELLMVTRGGDFVSYHRGSKRVEKLGMRAVKFSLYAESYVESLVLLDGVNEDFQGQYSRVDSQGNSHGGQMVEVDEGTLEWALKKNCLSAAAFVAGSLLGGFLLGN
ncbi:hypothetical protein Vadar_023294 [Vaccinium darrowii]|uniref:Uncharacterized protein n=2 Tax=Vaccinium darrowii TaxID=229202 RepID=A0ACB7YP64_9ERIC|nr:hypothetical protein Vadar_022189 [Vaccinium darrowii]KAH7855288.1 hypothetical protein Vadar_023294 [Vaccinium darrowii]